MRGYFRMKNILILTTVSGFLDKFERGNIAILQRMGFTVHYAANMNEQHYLFDEQEIRDMGVKIHHIDIARSPYMLKNNIKAYQQLVEIIEKNNICAIHCHTPVGGAMGRLMGWRFGKQKLRVVYTAHGFHFYEGAPLINNTVYYAVEKFLARYTDILVVINHEDYRNAKKLLMKREGHVYRIPGVGLDLDRFAPLSDEERKKKRTQLGISETDFYIVSVGELNENKNQVIILDSLAQMRWDGKDISHIKYGICGDGFFWERIQKKIQMLHLEENVIMHGYCKNVPEILGCADVSVFPSIREGLGMAGLEALAMGIPLLATNNRGTREYLQPGKNGYFCDSKNTKGWIDKIEYLRNMPSQSREEMQKKCRQTAEAFDRKYTDAVMERVYRDLNTKIHWKKRWG